MARHLLLLVVVVAIAVVVSCCSVVAMVPPPVPTLPTSRTARQLRGRWGIFIVITINFKRDYNYKVSCKEKGGPDCYVGCPKECPTKCIASCSQCRSFCTCDFFPGTSCGDPRFTGGDGNTFYFHGHKDQSFCIVSDADLHINAHFIGNHNRDLNRDFTWVQALGITFGGGRHRLYIGARKAARWDDDEDHVVIALDGEPITAAVAAAEGDDAVPPGLSVTRTAAVNSVLVELDGVFAVSATAVPVTDDDDRVHMYGRTGKDSLVHLDLGFRFLNLTENVDGVLGQTYGPGYVSKVDIGARMPVMGGANKYLSSGLFSTDCAVSKFQHGGVTAFVS